MTESPEEYETRLASYVEGRDAVAMQREAVLALARLMEGVDGAALSRRPCADKWSVTEIVAHLAEDELVSSFRYRQMLEHRNPVLLGFDQDLWAALGNYATWQPREALEMFRLLRETNLRMFDQLSPEQWDRGGEHQERGHTTVRDLCRHVAAHDINHLEQIKALLRM